MKSRLATFLLGCLVGGLLGLGAGVLLHMALDMRAREARLMQMVEEFEKEREAVLEYLRLCAVFWQTKDQRVDQWIYTVEQGGVPDFGANLNY